MPRLRLNPFAAIPNGKAVWAWGMYDLANQSFQLLIDTLLLAIYFKNVVAATPARGEALWGPMVGAAMLLVAVLSPVLGALADARAWRKRLLIGTGLVAVPLMAMLALLGPGMVWQTAALYITAKVMVGLGENFLASFLPELSTPATVGRISAIGWSMSYAGALLLLGVAAIAVWGLGATHPSQWKWMFVFAALWFLLGMLPAVVLLHERGSARPDRPGLLRIAAESARGLVASVREAGRTRGLARFLGVFFVYSLGTNTVVFFLGAIGDGFGFAIRELTLLALVMSATAGAAAAGAALVQDRVGHKRFIAIILLIWVLSTLAMALMASSGPRSGGGFPREAVWPIAAALGVALGGIGTASRAMVGSLTPEGRAGEFFGLWGMVYKLAGVVGPVTFGVVSGSLGRSTSLFLLCGFFLAGLALLPLVDGTRHKPGPTPA